MDDRSDRVPVPGWLTHCQTTEGRRLIFLREHRRSWSCCSRIAQAGGFLGRKGDGEPGWKTLWKGWLYIQTLLEGIHLASQLSLE